jgi:hypothetical protein
MTAARSVQASLTFLKGQENIPESLSLPQDRDFAVHDRRGNANRNETSTIERIRARVPFADWSDLNPATIEQSC